MDKVWIENGRLIKADPAIRLDFNAIAQGYSVDVISRFFDKLGLKNYLIEIGGEVRAKGTKNGARWRIGIDRPEENNFSPGEDLQAIIHISDESLATSGNYRKFYEKDGIKYSHTIDPETGYPARNNLLSATIIAPDCATADGIATACMVMGLARARELIEKNTSFLAFFVYSDEKGNFRTWTSATLAERISEGGNNQ
jgi:FAD:protein FMN transferase